MDTVLDAAAGGAADGAIDAMTERDVLALRLRSYVELLSIDFWVYQFLAAFPGVPKDTTFVAGSFRWSNRRLMPADKLQAKVGAIVQEANHQPRTATDDAVLAYARALASWLPKLFDLQAYYDELRFVDDEFDRGRRDSAEIAQARDELARLRVPMRSAVLTDWRELSSDVPDSPRAIVGAAWETCIKFADHLMAGDPPAALTAAVSACRRSIPTVGALPAGKGGEFATTLRGAAVAIGDRMANRFMTDDSSSALAQLTRSYLELWPTLSKASAERGLP